MRAVCVFQMKMVLVRRQRRTSDLMGSSSIETVLVKSDLSMRVCNFWSICAFTNYSNCRLFPCPALPFSSSIMLESKNLHRFSLLKRCTYSSRPVCSMERSSTPMTPSQRYSSTLFWTSSLSEVDIRAFVVSQAIQVLLVSDHLQFRMKEVEAAGEADDHCFDHVEVLHPQVRLLALLVLVFTHLLVQVEQRSHPRGDVVDLRQIARLVVSQQEPLVEAGNPAVVHLHLVLLLEPCRKAQEAPSLSGRNFVEVANVADAADKDVLAGRHGGGETVTADDVGVPVAVLESQVILHGLFQLYVLQVCLRHPQDHAEGLCHQAVVVHQTNAQNRAVFLVEVAFPEPSDKVSGSRLQVFRVEVLVLRGGKQFAEGDDVVALCLKGVESFDGGAVLGFEFDLIPECEGEGGEVDQLADLIDELQVLPILAEDVDGTVFHQNTIHLRIVHPLVHDLQLYDVVLVPLSEHRPRGVHHHAHHRRSEGVGVAMAHFGHLLES